MPRDSSARSTLLCVGSALEPVHDPLASLLGGCLWFLHPQCGETLAAGCVPMLRHAVSVVAGAPHVGGGASAGGMGISCASRDVAMQEWAPSPSCRGSGRCMVPFTTRTSSALHLACAHVHLIVHAQTTPSGASTYASCVRMARPGHVSNGHCLSLFGRLSGIYPARRTRPPTFLTSFHPHAPLALGRPALHGTCSAGMPHVARATKWSGARGAPVSRSDSPMRFPLF